MSQSPEQEGGLSPVAFDRDGLRLSVEPESRSKPQTPLPSQSQEAFPSVEAPRPSLAVLVIKPHAVKQRLKIEKRIVEAGFEIVKERKMGFHLDSAGVVELFAADAPSLSGDPVWVYVLSRARSASALVALAGPADPLVARKSDPESLRALYGSNRWENGVWVTRDEANAERVVNGLFPGSPMMEFSDLPSANSSPARKVRKATSHTSSLRSNTTASTRTKNLSGSGSRASLAVVNPNFKARPVPATTSVPTTTPRTTRAASLRAGNAAPPPPRPRMSQEERERTFDGVPGHKRRESIAVASTAPPVISPRANRSAMLRAQKLAEGSDPKSARRPSTSDGLDSKKKVPLSPEEAEEKKRATFEGVPGHKRRESISVPSTAPPAVSPRVNRSSMLRAQKLMGGGSGGPPSSFKGAQEGSPGPAPTRSLSTRSSRTSIGGAASSGSGSVSKASGAAVRPTVKTSSTASRASLAPSSSAANSGALTPISNGATTPRSAAAALPAKAPASPKKPEIVPRTNKSALLRAAAKLKSAAGVGGSFSRGSTGRASLPI
ncbi:hypothetical protein BDV93DRAFT_601411 [Ceratobasidium sp. AG-I]|nr:hypothetical protein BDV93DRAFT_601411 [Ceratobasidium sp. AG-I]